MQPMENTAGIETMNINEARQRPGMLGSDEHQCRADILKTDAAVFLQFAAV